MVITSSVINIQVCVITNIYMVLIRRRQWHPTPVLLPRKPHGRRSLVGCSPWGRWNRTWLSNFTFTFHFHALEKEMATHSGVLAWRIPGTGKPDGLPSMGSHRVGHDWSDLAAAAACLEFMFKSPHRIGDVGILLSFVLKYVRLWWRRIVFAM